MYLELSDPMVKSDNFTYDKCSTTLRPYPVIAPRREF